MAITNFKSYLYLFLIVLFLYTLNIKAQKTLSFTHITSVEGLSNNTVHDIVQDSDGYIWIATIEGLNKFDGINIVSYYNNPTNAKSFSNIILKLLVSSNGKMFVGTTKGLSIYNKNKNSFIDILYENQNLPWINDIIELSDKNIIISTVNGLYKYHNNVITKIKDGNFHSLTEYDENFIWAVTNNEIQVLDHNGKLVNTFNESTHDCNINFSADNLVTIFKDKRGTVWIGTSKNGLAYYDAMSDKFYNIRLKDGINDIEDNFIRAISEDKNGRLWIGTESGLYIYDIISQKFNFFGQDFDRTGIGLSDKAIYSIFKDRDGIMWIGTYFGGVNYTDPSVKGFNKIYADGGFRMLSGKALSSIIETTDGRIWIGTEDGGISVYDRKNRSFKYIKHNKKEKNTLLSNNVHALLEDEKGIIWIGTFLGGINKYNPVTNKMEKVTGGEKLSNVFSLEKDSQNRIWAATLNGLFRKDNDSFVEVYKETFDNKFLRHINEDSNGNIWICSYFFGVYKIDKNGNISNFNKDNTPGIINNMFLYSYEDSERNIWFGTQGGGLIKYDYSGQDFVVYTIKNGLPNNTVYAIIEDDYNNIWCSTTKGLSKLNLSTNQFENYNEYDGLVGNQFNYASCLKSKDGTLYFGAVNGLTYFNPKNIIFPKPDVDIHFTDFKLFNKSVEIKKNGILSSHIDDVKEITLDYADNIFSIGYININYYAPKKVQYSYFLEGFENNWNYVNSQISATYTNLYPGTYVFKVKATNGAENWSENIRTLKITVTPPFWLSIWGYLTYIIVIVIIVISYIRFLQKRNREKLNLRLIELDKQKNEELIASRINFFTYISHEFKTPLSIVIATIDEMLSENKSSKTVTKYGHIIKKNAYRLLFLINQLMEFRKIETDHASININRGDIIKYISSIINYFEPLLKKKSIDIRFKSEIDLLECYFDADKIEKIISNILSNSIKAFEEEGLITVTLDIIKENKINTLNNKYKSGSNIKIRISDNGPGISEEKLKKLFDPFYTSNNNNFDSGIGLAMVNSLIKLLDGTIKVISKVGTGTEFIITIPLFNIYDDEDHNSVFIDKVSDKNINLIINDLEKYIITENNTDGHKDSKHELLIVEDNKDLSSFLKKHFSKHYKTKVATNGEEALKQIERSQPDIIISDVMMPKIDGNQLCTILKENIETSHIPIILLTAKTGDESKIEGLSRGAEDYINKPFNLEELDLKVRNILKSIDDNKKRFAKFDTLDESIKTLQNHEAQFISKLTGIILENIDDTNFHINELCDKAFISRPHLHRKLKKITGLSTSEFIRNVRLNEAKKLLKTHSFTIAEVADKVGYTDYAYFSKSFKKVFDVSPSVFIKKQT